MKLCVFNPTTRLIDTVDYTGNILAVHITATATEDIPVGSLINLYPNAGVISVRKADSALNYAAHGFVTQPYASGATADVNLNGVVSLAGTLLSDQDTGTVTYLGTAGGIATSAPVTGLTQRVGKVLGLDATNNTVAMLFTVTQELINGDVSSLEQQVASLWISVDQLQQNMDTPLGRTLVYGSTITLDVSDRMPTYLLTLTGDTTISLANSANYQRFTLIVKQDGTGGHHLSWGANMHGNVDAGPDPSTATVFAFVCDDNAAYLLAQPIASQ